MPKISSESIKRMQKAIKDDYGVELDIKEVAKMIDNWVGYYNLLAEIYHDMKTEVGGKNENAYENRASKN